MSLRRVRCLHTGQATLLRPPAPSFRTHASSNACRHCKTVTSPPASGRMHTQHSVWRDTGAKGEELEDHEHPRPRPHA
jgi:hypothetical protein